MIYVYNMPLNSKRNFPSTYYFLWLNERVKYLFSDDFSNVLYYLYNTVNSPKKATKLPNENESKQPGSSSKDGNIDASNCAFSKSETSQACDVPSISVQPPSPQRCNHDNGDPDANKAKKADDVEMTQSNKDTVALTNDQLIVTYDGTAQQQHNSDCNNDNNVSTTDRSTSKQKSEKELTHISSKTNLDLDSSMNPHEITFNISMTAFDQALQEEKNVMFRTTYDESIKKAEQQQVMMNFLPWKN